MDVVSVLTSLVKVAIVFGLLIGTLRMLGRFQERRNGVRPKRGGGGRQPERVLEILDQSRVGRTSSVVAIRVGDRALLLGVTDGEVSTLADVTDDIDLAGPDDDEVNLGAPSPSTVLDQAMDMLRTGSFRS